MCSAGGSSAETCTSAPRTHAGPSRSQAPAWPRTPVGIIGTAAWRSRSRANGEEEPSVNTPEGKRTAWEGTTGDGMLTKPVPEAGAKRRTLSARLWDLVRIITGEKQADFYFGESS